MNQAKQIGMYEDLAAHCHLLIKEYSDALSGPLYPESKWENILGERIEKLKGLLVDIEAEIV